MGKTIISEGKTTSEAIQNGLNQLKVSKRDVEIKVLEEDNKKSFFNILAPRVVKVELTLKDEIENKTNYKEVKEEEFKVINENLEKFLNSFIEKAKIKNINYEIKNEIKQVTVDINGDNLNYLIGYRGETLNSLQTILNRIGNKGIDERHRIIVDIARL